MFVKKDNDHGESDDALDHEVAVMKTQDVEHTQTSLLKAMRKKYVPNKTKRAETGVRGVPLSEGRGPKRSQHA